MAKIPRIAVVGSANIDLTTFTGRFPKPGETIFGQKFDLGFGGKGANQATASRLCGAAVFMVARVGCDLFGPATIENFKKLGIDATHVKQVEGVSSGVAPIFVEPNGQNRIFVVKGANDELKPADVDAAADLLKAVDCIVLQFEIPLETVYYTIGFARKRSRDHYRNASKKSRRCKGVCGEVAELRHSPRHYYARRQRFVAGGEGRHGTPARIPGEECRQHRRRRCLHWQLRSILGGRASRTRGATAPQTGRSTLNRGRWDAEVFLRSSAVRRGVGGPQQTLVYPSVQSTDSRPLAPSRPAEYPD